MSRKAIVFLLFISCRILAGEPLIPNSFSNGALADAGQMNENFSSLAAGITTNEGRIASLEAQILPAEASRFSFLGYINPSTGPEDTQCKVAFSNDSAHLATTEEWMSLLRLSNIPLPATTAKLISYGPYPATTPTNGKVYELHTGMRMYPSTVPGNCCGGKVTFWYTTTGGFSNIYFSSISPYTLACVGYVTN